MAFSARKSWLTALVAAIPVLIGGWAHAASFEGYLTTTSGKIVRTPYGECIKTGSWNRGYAQPECDQALEQRAMKAAAQGLLGSSADVTVGTPLAERGKVSMYEVSRGESLWVIASRPEVFGDAKQWPRLLCANRKQIRDADLVYPGQVLDVVQVATAEERAAAARHAATRGPWEVGYTEDADLEYLALHCNR